MAFARSKRDTGKQFPFLYTIHPSSNLFDDAPTSRQDQETDGTSCRIRAVDDVRKVPDNVLSTEPSSEELGILNMNDSFHSDVIRSKLTRNNAAILNEVREELIMAMDDSIPTRKDSWDYDYQTLNLTFAVNVVKFGLIIGMFPNPLKPIVSRMLSNLPSQIRQEIEFIRPTLRSNLQRWGRTGRTVLYRLLANPKYTEPLREEVQVDVVIKEKGWTKARIDKMYKMDNFLRRPGGSAV
ncbi:hypothetical protein V8E52_005059 [Russula decolorans]